MAQLHEIATTEDAARATASRGAAWDAAARMGIDVTLLARNAQLTPAERIAQLDRANRFAWSVQQRTVPEATRRAAEQRRLREKVEALGDPFVDPR